MSAWHAECLPAGYHDKEVVIPMCMSCGCGDWNERHKPGDIILDDLKKAAQNSNIDVEKAADNIHDAARQVRSEDRS